MYSFVKVHPLLKILNSSLWDLPSPSNISSMWNFGSLLGFCLASQLLTGVFLAMHYSSDVSVAFDTVNHITRDVNFGWAIRMAHANGASMFFICLYLHASRGMYYGSYKLKETWILGVVIMLLVMATAFMGYVLPWGQMSFWGATVITNLFSAIPQLGGDIVYWLWGGFSVNNPTLTRFFAFHFLLPFIISAMVGVHLLFLHQTGSSNPLGVLSNKDKINFHPYFSFKDLLGVFVLFWGFSVIVLLFPWSLGDPENFIPANPLVTPVHIQPEWYFLFAYAILRSIPNKLGGVMALAGSILILIILSFFPYTSFQGCSFYPLSKLMFWNLVFMVILLTWIGARPVEEPFVFTGQVLTVLYFLFYFSYIPLMMFWDSILN